MAATGTAAGAGSAAAWPWIMAGVGALGSAVGGMMGGQSQGAASDTSREANRRSVELGRNQALINSQTMAPFTGAGMLALQELYGYTPVSSTTGVGGAAGGVNVPTLNLTGSRWDSPTVVGSQAYAKTGTGIDPTGGAGAYLSKIGQYPGQFVGQNPAQYLSRSNDLIGQLGQYGTNFQFDYNNPAYTQQLAESTKAMNTALAARGMYNSRAGINALDQSTRNLVSSEYDKQYTRGYSNIMDMFGMTSNQFNMARQQDETAYTRGYSNLVDMFNMSNSLGQQKYNSLLDAVKIGTGSGAAAGGLGNTAAGNANSAYANMSNSALVSGQQNANLYAGLGAMPMNYMILSQLLNAGSKASSPGVNNSNAFLNYGTNAGMYGSPWQ